MSDNDAEELLPVTAFEKVIKTTIRQAASPVTGQDMWEAYKAAIPGATVTVSPEGAMPRKWVLAGFSAAVLVWLGGLIALAASVGWLADNAHYIATIGLLLGILAVAGPTLTVAGRDRAWGCPEGGRPEVAGDVSLHVDRRCHAGPRRYLDRAVGE